jgi:O-antigen ligase
MSHAGRTEVLLEQLESPFDRAVYSVLLVLGLIILIRRGGKVAAVLSTNAPILTYFAYCLLSAVWSDFPEIAFKRWVKCLGDLTMVLIIATDADPKAALKRVFSRVGFILLPASVLLIKYYPNLGRGFSPWDGTPWNTGVTTNKNTLGVIVLVLSIGTLWSVLTLLNSKTQANRWRHLLAQITALGFCLSLLVLANCATCRACFGLAAVLMLATNLPAIRRRPRAVHALVLVMVLGAGLTMLLGGVAALTHAAGRKADFTGRTEIWEALIPMAPNWLVGAGFESFWLGPRVQQIRDAFEGNPLNEAHNGYIEVYLNSGCVGLALITWILISGYWRAATVFRRDPTFGSLLLSFVVAVAVYNITEAGFRLLMPSWIFLLFAVIASSAAISTSSEIVLPAVAPPIKSVTGPFANGASPLRRRRV